MAHWLVLKTKFDYELLVVEAPDRDTAVHHASGKDGQSQQYVTLVKPPWRTAVRYSAKQLPSEMVEKLTEEKPRGRKK